MAIPVWPSSLPLKIRYGTEMEFGARSKAITEMDFGPTLLRNRFITANVPYKMNAEIHFSDEQYRVFLSWWVNVLKNGVKSFYAPVMTDLDVVNMLCKLPMESIKPRFQDYNRVVIPLTFEIRGNYTIPEELLYMYNLWGEENFIDFSDILQQAVNIDLPEALESLL